MRDQLKKLILIAVPAFFAWFFFEVGAKTGFSICSDYFLPEYRELINVEHVNCVKILEGTRKVAQSKKETGNTGSQRKNDFARNKIAEFKNILKKFSDNISNFYST